MAENNQQETSPQEESQQSGDSHNSKDVNKFDLPLDSIDPEVVIPDEVKPIFKKLGENERKTVMSAIIAMSVKRSWTGPIPPPDILAGYNDIVPNGAERIFKMAENQSKHRIEIEKTVITRELDQSGRGQNYAMIIVILVLIASFILIYSDHDVAGGVLGAVDLVALASVFIIGKFAQKKDVANKK